LFRFGEIDMEEYPPDGLYFNPTDYERVLRGEMVNVMATIDDADRVRHYIETSAVYVDVCVSDRHVFMLDCGRSVLLEKEDGQVD